MIETQPGEGRNDIMGLAFLIVFVAFLINGHQRRAPGRRGGRGHARPARGPARQGPADHGRDRRRPGDLGQADLAGAGRRDRRRGGPLQRPRAAPHHRLGDGRWRCSWSAATGTCGRRSRPAATRSPRSAWGRCNLPRPDQMPLDPRPRFSVAHYLGEPTIYRKWFFPELDNALGPLFPLILVIAFAAAVYIVVPIAQPDPAGARGGGAADRGRLRVHAADRGRPGGRADAASSPTPAT